MTRAVVSTLTIVAAVVIVADPAGTGRPRSSRLEEGTGSVAGAPSPEGAVPAPALSAPRPRRRSRAGGHDP